MPVTANRRGPLPAQLRDCGAMYLQCLQFGSVLSVVIVMSRYQLSRGIRRPPGHMH